MIDPLFVANLGPYSLQVATIAILAGLLPLLLPINVASVRYAYWRTVFALCLVVPWLQRPMPPVVTDEQSPTTITSFTTLSEAAWQPTPSPIDWSPLLIAVIAGGIALRLLWMAVGFVRLHRLRRAGEPAPRDQHATLQDSLRTNADVRYVSGLRQPVTFGLRHPVVLLPDTLRTHASEIREAVLAHELVHVRRRDWAWVIPEEIVRGILWFHPAIWWLISRVQLAREEVVDATVVALTGRRRTYVEALLAFADATPLAPAPAFAWRRHLFRRIVLISREDAMSVRRLIGSCVVMTLVVASGTWYALGAFPMSEISRGQEVQMEPGPLERAANPITPENPIPRRVSTTQAVTPPQVAAIGAGAVVTVRTTVNNAGQVAEARATRMTVEAKSGAFTFAFRNTTIVDVYRFASELAARSGAGSNSEPKLLLDAIVNAAVAAAQQWRYDAPFKAPIAFDVNIPVGNAPPPPPPPPPPAGAPMVVDGTGALRVGGNVKQPTKIKNVAPMYPPEAQEQKVQGVVIIQARIGADGRVEEAAVLRSIPLLDQAALDAVRQWEFQPTLMNGVATPVILTVTVQFSLQ